ncbi:ATP-dependent DNA helicase [Trichonephila clavipes]|nr:ATP-dependent DNA helicase [Trichonephila clavipes]
MMTQRRQEFCEIMTNIYYIVLRNNPSHYTTIGRTTIDRIFSTHGLRTCGNYKSAFSTHLPLYVQMPWEKKKVRTSYPQGDNDPSLECGPDLLDRTGDIDWAEDEMTSQTEKKNVVT